MKNWIVTCAALAACAVPLHAAGASAATIDYIFIGTGSGVFDGRGFAGDFRIAMIADTSTVTSGGGEFRNDVGTMVIFIGGLRDTITAPLVLTNAADPGFAGFGQELPPFPSEDLTNAIFQTYNLMTALPFTSGGLSVAPATFQTGGGTVDFETITALSF
jgi:hypothetical protein